MASQSPTFWDNLSAGNLTGAFNSLFVDREIEATYSRNVDTLTAITTRQYSDGLISADVAQQRINDLVNNNYANLIQQPDYSPSSAFSNGAVDELHSIGDGIGNSVNATLTGVAKAIPWQFYTAIVGLIVLYFILVLRPVKAL